MTVTTKNNLELLRQNTGKSTSIVTAKDNSSQSKPQALSSNVYSAKIKQIDLITFTTQLSVMLDSGVVLSDALDAIVEQAEEGTLRTIMSEIAESVKGGERFSRILSMYPKAFNSLFVSMVKAAEASGRMSEMLNVLSSYLNFEFETRKQIKGALIYPCIMAVMALLSTASLIFFVLPKFTKIYAAKGAALPKLTQIIMWFSTLAANPQALMITLTIIFVASVVLFYSFRTETGRKVIDYLKINTPALGTMFLDSFVTRSMRIMATMINTGVSLLDTIEVIKGSCENYYFKQLWEETDKKIRDGFQLSESIKASAHSDLIAIGVIQMLKAGEKSGKLGSVSDKISIFYEKKLEHSIKGVTALIEPLMIIIMGGVIGTIAIGLLMPIFKISQVISQ